MSYSFIAAPASEREQLREVIDELRWDVDVASIGAWCIAVESGNKPRQSCTTAGSGASTLLLVGDILNRDHLRAILCLYNSAALTANDAELMALAFEELGERAVGIAEGAFVGLIFDHADASVRLFTDVTGMMPCLVTTDAGPWISSEAKLLRRKPGFRLDFTPLAQLVAPERRPDNFTPLRHVHRVKPGEFVKLAADGYGKFFVERQLAHAFRPRADRDMSQAHALEMVDMLLQAAVHQCVSDSTSVGIPLSGGLDSSLVTSLARRSVRQLSTFAIGTELSNEFVFAEEVAKFVGTSHKEFLLSDDDVLTGLIESIYYNEIYDGLSAEIQAPLFALYKKLAGSIDTLVTGYGSDLLFGGILPLQAPGRAANDVLWEQIYRTRWTGEFSAFGASHYGMEVRHPFWSNRLIGFCLDLSPSLKVSTEEVKLVLREYAARNELLPSGIVWRKKIGIHEGSSINRMFASKLKTDVSRYDMKSVFTYFVYREFFENGRTPQDLGPDEVIARFKTSLK